MNALAQIILLALLWSQAIQQPDSDFITLKRSVCYGRCPAYSVTVYLTGAVEYVGDQFVRVVGHRSYDISKDSVAFLFLRAKKIGFFSLKSEYQDAIELRKNANGKIDTLKVIVTDLPAYRVSVKIGEQTKSVLDYFQAFGPDAADLKKFEAPEELREFENEIDRITKTEDLIKTK